MSKVKGQCSNFKTLETPLLQPSEISILC